MNDNNRPVAIYERGTDRILCIYPTMHAKETHIAFMNQIDWPCMSVQEYVGFWHKYCWEYADTVLDADSCDK